MATSTPAVEQTTLTSEDRALLRMALRLARADGWRPRYPAFRSSFAGQWIWTNPTWPRTRPPAGARRVVFDGRHLTVQSCEGGRCWVADVVLRVTTLSQAVDTLAALDVLPSIAAGEARPAGSQP